MSKTISYISNDMNRNMDLFATVLGTCDEKNLQGFISLLGKFDTDPGTTGVKNYQNLTQSINGARSSFIPVAYQSGLEQNEINRLGNQALALGEERFRDIFGMTNLGFTLINMLSCFRRVGK